MSWFGYKSNRNRGAMANASDRVLRSRNPSQGMGNNVSLQNPPLAGISPVSPTITQPLSQDQISQMHSVTRNLSAVMENQDIPDDRSHSEKDLVREQCVTYKKSGKEPIVKLDDFKQVNEDEKLNLLMVAINKIGVSVNSMNDKLDSMYEALNDEEDGVFPRLRDCESVVNNYKDRIESLKETNELLKNDVSFLRGVVQVQERKIEGPSNQLLDSKAHSMKDNLTISGITGDGADEENCATKVKSFFQHQMSLEVEDSEIKIVHRLGEFRESNNPRQMVVKCAPSLRSKVFGYTKNLKGKKNSLGKHYYVDPQLPEQHAAERKEINYQIAKIKKFNEGKKLQDQIKFQVQ